MVMTSEKYISASLLAKKFPDISAAALPQREIIEEL
jgi:hypothetical protein